MKLTCLGLPSLQTAHLGRPPTQLEVEVELATPDKSGHNRGSSSKGVVSNSRARGKGVEDVRNELYSFKDSVKGEFSEMSALMKELLFEVRKQNRSKTNPSSSEIGTTRLDIAGGDEAMEGHVVVCTPEPQKAQE